MKSSRIIATLFLALMGCLVANVFGVNPMIGAAVFQSIQFIPMQVGVLGVNALSSKVIEEQRQAFHQEMVDINKAAEGRKFNEEERAKFDKAKENYDNLEADLREAKEREELEQREATRQVGATQKENEKKQIRKYSFMSALRSVANNEPLEGFEKEMDQEARQQALADGVSLSGKRGLVIPPMILDPNAEQRAGEMTAGTAADGGNAVPTVMSDFIGALQNALVLTQLGADFMTGLKGNVDMVTETAVAAATWEGEIDKSSQSAPKVGKIQMIPKRLGTHVLLSNQLLLQTSPSIEARIRRQMLNAIKLGIEQAAINGSGVAPIPEGILTKGGIGSVVGGANGLIPTWAKIVELESKIAAANADIGTMGYLVNAVTRGILKSTPKVAGAAGMIWENGATPLNGYKAAVTNAVPSNLDKGTSEDICSAIIFGNWADLMIGAWSGVEIIADPYSRAEDGLLKLVVNSFNDIQVGHEASFSAMLDALTQ